MLCPQCPSCSDKGTVPQPLGYGKFGPNEQVSGGLGYSHAVQGIEAIVDIKTVMLMMGFGHLAIGLILLVYRSSGADRRLLDTWTVVQFAKAGATLLIALRGEIPDVLSSIGGNGLTFLAFGLELLVFRFYVFRQWQFARVGIAVGALLTLFLVDALVLAPHPTAGNAAIIVSGGLALLTLFSGITLLQAPRPRSALLLTLAAANLLMATTAAARACTLLVMDGLPAFSTVLPNQLMFHGAYLLMLINGFGFLLLMKQEVDANLRRLSETDSLTGLCNRRAFATLAELVQRRSRRTGEPNALVLLDLDNFKQVNDTYGHAAGDEVLKSVATVIREQMRDMDICSRCGGEEFAVTMPGATLAQAVSAAERLRVAIASVRYVEQPSDQPLVTISVGVTALAADETLGAALARADAALYKAKRAGRDRVVTSES